MREQVMVPELGPIIVALYRALRPVTTGDAWRSERGWFLYALNARGVEVSRTRLHSWIRDGVPESRADEVWAVVWNLYGEAHDKRLDELLTLTRAIRP